jgi:hypothetical protein
MSDDFVVTKYSVTITKIYEVVADTATDAIGFVMSGTPNPQHILKGATKIDERKI